MIARYSRPEFAKIWDDRNRYNAWLKVELAVCEGLAREKRIPRAAWARLRSKAVKYLKNGGVDPRQVEKHEKTTRHDLIAFTTTVAEALGEEARYVHFGLTSSDVIDTAFALLMTQASEELIRDARELQKTLLRLAKKYKSLPTIGRSHGIFAEPTSFGLKFLGWYTEWKRNEQRLVRAAEAVRYGKLSGAVGVSAHWDPGFEERVLDGLGLKREPVSTQVVPRDRHAEWMQTIALCGSSLERMAVELRHLQRSEVGEVLEGFARGQKGSSAMPHKRNPISSENITGCARLLRAYAQSALESVALWHERDISHSAVERVAVPDASILLDYAIRRMNQVMERLEVKKPQVQAHLKQAGEIVFSGHVLLALVERGVQREEAYSWVQECAFRSLEGRGSFSAMAAGHKEIRKLLRPGEIKKLCSTAHQLRHVPQIYRAASDR